MDYSPRQRYRARRRAANDRRRRLGLLACGVVLILIGLGLAYRRPSAPPSAPVATPAAGAPTAAPQRPSPTNDLAATPRPAAAAPTPPAQAEVLPGTPAPAAPAPFFDDQRLTYEPDFYTPQVQGFLDTQPGTLKRLAFQVGDRQHTFAETLVSQTSYYSVNPKVVLALLELQSSLLSTAGPSAEQVGWAMGYRGENGNRRGLSAQVRWAVRQIVYGKRAYPNSIPLTYADNSSVPPPPGMGMSEYVVAYVLAQTTTPDRLPSLLQRFQAVYTSLFGDPRPAPEGWPAPSAPFLAWPMQHAAQVTSFFDHDAPFLTRDASSSITTYWGRSETDIAFAYDGHDGWDYALAPPDMALAAADGQVIFAGNADDGCATRAVILDHGNGYRTLYWHLASVDVETGQPITRGQTLGMIGASGCATGPHLHFGVQYLGRNTDPYGWCGAEPDPWQQHPAGTISNWLWSDRPSPCMPPPVEAILVDTDSPGFAKDGDGWQTVPVGYGGSALFVSSTRGAADSQPWELRPLVRPAVALWQPELPVAGRYRVLAYLPYALSGLDDALSARYRIHYSGGEAEITVNLQERANDWIDLGTYQFAPGDKPSVALSSMAETDQRSIWVDAVLWLPADQP